jgi:hypothetical protein
MVMRKVFCILFLLMAAPLTMVEARSVHNAYDVDLFPNGSMDDANNWTLSDKLAFSDDPSLYTEAMITDGHLSINHSREINSQEQYLWASTSSTDSNASIGSADGAYTWTNGALIKLDGYDTSLVSQYELMAVKVIVSFAVPEQLNQDSVRFSLAWDNTNELLAEWKHSQGGMDFINGAHWSKNVMELGVDTWDDIEDIELTFDYVSVGQNDDSQLQIDAAAIMVEVRTPWYGVERAEAFASSVVETIPVAEANWSNGTFTNMAQAPCGIQPSQDDVNGIWVSGYLERPAEQSVGRIHITTTDSFGEVLIEYSSSSDNSTWSEWNTIAADSLVPNNPYTRFKLQVNNTCVSRMWVDINDPTITISGSISGSIDGIEPTSSRWLVLVNGMVALNEPVAQLGSFNIAAPIGEFLSLENESIDIEIKAWFSWNSSGNASTTILNIDNIDISGGFTIEWDEDPICEAIPHQEMDEDGGGVILPLMDRCSDDRDLAENLQVAFTLIDQGIIAVDMTEGQIRIRLLEDASGSADFITTVTDSAGNSWSQVTTVNVAEVDDKPELAAFPAIIPVEHSFSTTVPFTLTDRDSTISELSITTNRSWAVTDIAQSVLYITAPTPGFTSILVSACDATNCVERILDLEVKALPDLIIEELRSDTMTPLPGEIITIKIMVRNSGQVKAEMISVRCLVDDSTIDIGIIPILNPGTLGSVSCNMQVPQGDSVIRLSAVVDIGGEIDEKNEDNNEAEIILTVGSEEVEITDDVESFTIANGVAWGSTIAVILIIITLFALFAPSKIKRID